MPEPRSIRLDALAYGGDYNPDQWSEETWLEDARLMVEAGVNIVSLPVFSWPQLEPTPGVYNWGWLDRVIEVLWGAGIKIDLATATATPPSWLIRRHPEMLPHNVDGQQLEFGSRQAYCPSSPGLEGKRRPDDPRDGRTLRQPPGAGPVAHLQRIRRPRLALLVPGLRRAFPRLAAEPLHHPRGPERGLGRGRVGPALHRVGPHRAAAHRHRAHQPDPAAGLRALLLRRAAGTLPGGNRRAARGHPGHRRHHQLHVAAARPELLGLRRGGGPCHRRRLPGPGRPAGPRRRGAELRPDALAEGRCARGCCSSSRPAR